MKSTTLKSLIQKLVEVEPRESPLISCFIDLAHPRSTALDVIEAQAAFAAKQMEAVS
jgi:hypothetical protein